MTPTMRNVAVAITAWVTCVTMASSTTDTVGRLFLTGGILGSANIHRANFTELPSVPNRGSLFTSGFGTGGVLLAGVEYQPAQSSIRLGAALSYHLMSATLRSTEFVGNIIRGNEVVQGKVEHQLVSQYAPVSVEPYVALPIPGVDNMLLRVGGAIGIPLTRSYTQRQLLLTPEDRGYTFASGGRTYNESEGDLPRAAALYMAAIVGLRYDVAVHRLLRVSPEISYTHGLTNIVDNLDWNISSIRFGVGFTYYVPRTAPPPPPPPVAVRPAPPTVILSAVVGTTLVDATTISLPCISETVTITRAHVPPVVYFDEGGTEFAGGANLDAPTSRMLDAVAAAIRQNPEAHVTITVSLSASEPSTLFKARQLWATDRVGPIDQSRLTFVRLQAPPSRYPALDAEHRYVRFDVGERGRAVAVDDVHDVKREATPSDLTFVATTNCPAVACSTQTTVTVNGAPTTTRGALAEAQTVTLTGEMLESAQPVTVEARTEIIDTVGQRATASLAVLVQPTIRTTDTTVRHTSQRDGDAIVVGYFDFDGNVITSVNTQARDVARQAVREGKRLELRVGTDGFGSEAYNNALAQHRAKAAAEALGVSLASCTVTPVRHTEGTGTTPAQRSQYRSTTLRIIP